jgi:hypothetical protein
LPRTKNSQIERAILNLWLEGKETREIPYKLISEELQRLGVSKRTVPRYLMPLISRKILERRKISANRTVYKPKNPFWKEYLSSLEKTRNREESFQEIGSLVLNRISRSVEDTKSISDKFYSKVWKEIGAKTNDEQTPEDSSDVFEDAIDTILRKRPKKAELSHFYRLYNQFIRSYLDSLTDPIVFARLDPQEEVTNLVQEHIVELLESYMALWDYLYKHPNLVSKLSDILENEDIQAQKIKKRVRITTSETKLN